MAFRYPCTRWVRLNKAAELTGYTEKALRDKIYRGQLIMGKTWRNAPDGRLVVNIEELDRWLESAHQKP